MANYTISLRMLKLQGACLRNLKGKTATKRCLIIPVDDNPGFFVGEKDVYLNLVANENQTPSQYGDTHYVKGSLTREQRDAMTEEQRHALPILGNMKPLQRQEMQPQGSTLTANDFTAAQPGDADDLPF